jgi:hypothetical protein
MLELTAVQQITNDPCIFRNLYVAGLFHRAYRRERMNIGADTAGALDKMVGIPGIAPLEHHLDAPEHLSGTPGIRHLAVCHFHLYSKVPLYSGNGINNDSFTHNNILSHHMRFI